MTEERFNELSKKFINIINDTKKNWADPNDKCVEIRVINENLKLKSYVGRDHVVMKFIVQKYYDVQFKSKEGNTYAEDGLMIEEDGIDTLFYDGIEFLNSCELNFDDSTDLINYNNGKIILKTGGSLNSIMISYRSKGYKITEESLGFTPQYYAGMNLDVPSKHEAFKYNVEEYCIKIFQEWSKIKGFSKNEIKKVYIHLSGYGNGSEGNVVKFELSKEQFVEIYGDDEFDELDLDEKGYYKEESLESYDAISEALTFEPEGEFVAVIRDVFYTEDEIGFDVSEREISSTDKSIDGYYLMYGGAYDCEGKQLSKKDLEKFNNSSQERSCKYDGIDLYRLEDFDLEKELKTNF